MVRSRTYNILWYTVYCRRWTWIGVNLLFEYFNGLKSQGCQLAHVIFTFQGRLWTRLQKLKRLSDLHNICIIIQIMSLFPDYDVMLHGIDALFSYFVESFQSVGKQPFADWMNDFSNYDGSIVIGNHNFITWRIRFLNLRIIMKLNIIWAHFFSGEGEEVFLFLRRHCMQDNKRH